ncbi:hypothetical protein LZ31DRAFT_232166 [Colletotrichum somersetense]|nr:hypothetical protein LZ31DRAFT_232166 [Colletotrichum somersetense]
MTRREAYNLLRWQRRKVLVLYTTYLPLTCQRPAKHAVHGFDVVALHKHCPYIAHTTTKNNLPGYTSGRRGSCLQPWSRLKLVSSPAEPPSPDATSLTDPCALPISNPPNHQSTYPTLRFIDGLAERVRE